MTFLTTNKSWVETYEVRRNEDGTVDIILPKPEKYEQRTFKLFEYQLEFLKNHYDAPSISEALRLAIDDLIKSTNHFDNIILVSQEVR